MLNVTELSGFGVAEEYDLYWNNVTLLIRADGPDGSTAFIDLSKTQNALTPGGNAHIEVDQYKWGGSSAAFDGNGDTISFANTAITGDFTFECWAYVTAWDASGYNIVISTSGSNGEQLYVDSDGLGLVIDVSVRIAATGSSVTLNSWHHLAWTRSGTTVRTFLDGIKIGESASGSGTINLGLIGSYYSPSFDTNGYIDDIRLTDGIARYTTDFTPPSAQFPNQ